MDDMLMGAGQTIVRAVQERKVALRDKMGREYASGHEVWAKIKQLMEEAKADEKTVESLQGELWKAIKEDNDDEISIELHTIGNKAMEICMTFATIAAEAHRAADELRARN